MMAKTDILFITLGGLLGAKFSAGMQIGGKRVERELGAVWRHYRWMQGRRAAEEAADFDGVIVLAWHSAGETGAARFVTALNRKIALAFAVDSWLRNQTMNPLIKRVYSITAGKGGRFNVLGGNVVEEIVYPDETHTSIDDEPKLHKFFVEKIGEIMTDQSTLPVVPVGSTHNSILKDYEGTWQNFMDPARETPQQKAWQDAFFEGVRGSVLKPLSQSQVDGLKTMIFIWRLFYSENPITYFAGVAGQSVKETGGKMVAVRETFATSDAQAVARLERAWANGQLKAVGVRRTYWRDVGNGHGFGRGIIQLSLDSGYRKAMAMLWDKLKIKVDLVQDYNLALDPLVSAIVAFGGCIHGTFTSKKFSDYVQADGSFDFYNARSVVNGDKGRVGKEIEQDCQSFLSALEAAERAAPGWLAKDFETTEPVPVDPVPVPTGELTLENLRTWSSAELMVASIKAADLIKNALIVRHERDNPEIETEAANPLPIIEETDMSFINTKSLFKSKTILGIAAAGIAMVFPASKPILDLFVPDTASLSPETIEQLVAAAKQTFEGIRLFVELAGLAFAAYGRKVADTKI